MTKRCVFQLIHFYSGCTAEFKPWHSRLGAQAGRFIYQFKHHDSTCSMCGSQQAAAMKPCCEDTHVLEVRSEVVFVPPPASDSSSLSSQIGTIQLQSLAMVEALIRGRHEDVQGLLYLKLLSSSGLVKDGGPTPLNTPLTSWDLIHYQS